MSKFVMSQDVYRKVAAHKDNAETWAQIASVYEITDGVKREDFDAEFERMGVEMAKVIVREGLEKDAAGMSVTKGITEFAMRASKAGFSLTITWDEESEKATIGIAGKRGRKASKDGKVSSGSNISAWNAYKKGKAMGDTFVVTKADGGHKVDGRYVANRVNGGLVTFILKMFPDSKTAKVLGDYGKSL